MNEPFRSFRGLLKERFPGCKVVKIPIHSGLSCPNRDGKLSRRGCIYCDRYASGPPDTVGWPIEEQVETFMKKHPGRKYIAYFQSYCNTYGPVAVLEKKYAIALRYENIVGIFIGTRPDAISRPAFSLLERIHRRTWLSVELGLQSIHDHSLLLLNRNHTYGQFCEAFQELKRRGIETIVHLIIGIPGETRQHMVQTVEALNALRPAGVKFHLLHVLRGTEMYERYVRSPFPLLSQEEYTDLVVDLLERLHPAIVVHRLSADRERELFYAPSWALNKAKVLRSIRTKLAERGSHQGRLCHDA
ncbi:MAG: TIGR01212 family radical SAM protein [Candidatus Aminicenantes bacterium]|nr:TIGR01212 family radical SAM protein [Candidatus Aminicenantes bacterium]